MNLEKILNSKYAQIKRVFIIGIIAMISICVLFTLLAIFSGTYPNYFIKVLLSAAIIIGYCMNSIVCLKTNRFCKKIPWSWIGVILCTITVLLFLIVIWTDFNILSYALGSLAITLTYTSAIIPFALIKAKNSKLYNAILITHRIVTPAFGILLMVDFAFNITATWVLQITWALLLIEIFIVLSLSLLYIFPHYKKNKKKKTEEEGIFIDQNGNKYQLIKNKDDDVAEEDEDNTIQLDIKKEEKID